MKLLAIPGHRDDQQPELVRHLAMTMAIVRCPDNRESSVHETKQRCRQQCIYNAGKIVKLNGEQADQTHEKYSPSMPILISISMQSLYIQRNDNSASPNFGDAFISSSALERRPTQLFIWIRIITFRCHLTELITRCRRNHNTN